MHRVKKIFTINLPDRLSRWNLFKDIDPRIVRFEAVDSRSNWYIYREYGLDCDPQGLTNKYYFTQSKGAVGCYLSHYLIWKEIVNQNIPWALILEDDARVKDVKKILTFDFSLNDDVQVLQLNKRMPIDPDIYRSYYDGTESYIISKSGAEMLINNTHDCSHFQGVIDILPEPFQCNFSRFLNESTPDLSGKRSIKFALDKFIGFSSDYKLNPDVRLKLKIDPRVGLTKLNPMARLKLKIDPRAGVKKDLIQSDVCSEEKQFWKMTDLELDELHDRDDFEWWRKKES